MALYVSELKPLHDVAQFDCGSPELTTWLQQTARQHQKKHLSKTYVLTDDVAPNSIIGFFTLAIRRMATKEELPAAMAKKLPNNIPCFTLARLAVATHEKRKGYGELLLITAMQKVREVSTVVGGFALFIDAKDQQAADFYKKYGFVEFPSNSLILVMPIDSFSD